MSFEDQAPGEAYDLVVVGSGAAGMAAAITARLHGLDVAVVEKEATYGGSTAVSGGAIWIPDNPKMRAAGINDSAEAALAYIAAEAGNRFDRALVEAFLRHGPEMVAFFEANTALQFDCRTYSPDYHPDVPGAALGGRVLDAQDYDGRRLGRHFARLRPPIKDFTILGGLMLNRIDIGHFLKMSRSLPSALHAGRLVLRHLRDRLAHPRGTRLVLGQAVAGRLAETLFGLGIPLFLETGLTGFVREGGRIAGIETQGRHGRRTIMARVGVVLATGGFPHGVDLRDETMPQAETPLRFHSLSPAGNTGDAIRIGRAAGARFVTSNSNPAFWTPVSLLPDGDGGRPFPHLFLDRAKPGVIAVTHAGRRFVNEAVSYHDFVQGMLAALAEDGRTSAWLVCDHRALRRYGLGAVPPFPGRIGPYLSSGYLRRGRTVRELAEAAGINADGLAATLAQFNTDAAQGQDTAFGKGSTAYQTYLGDAEVAPNPCLAPLSAAPFYAVEIFPGDIGTSAGLATNADGQVLDEDGAPIAGLYACGNDMNSIMGGAYPGAGITLGPALTFGYIVARHAARVAGGP